MKKCLFIALLSMIIMSACKSEEEVVKEKFLDYVQLEFDDPSVITEIMSVEKPVTYTLQEGKKFLKSHRMEFNSISDSLWDASQWLTAYKEKYAEYNKKVEAIDYYIREGWNELTNCEPYVSYLDSIYSKIGDEDVIEKVYQIRVRERKEGSIKKEYYYASLIGNDYFFYSSDRNRGQYVLMLAEYDSRAYRITDIIRNIRLARVNMLSAKEAIKELILVENQE